MARWLRALCSLSWALLACAGGEDAQRLEADAYVKAYYARTQALTTDGERLGSLLFDVVDGKATDGAEVRRAHAAFRAGCAQALAEVKADAGRLALPAFAEWHAAATRYLAFECDSVADFPRLIAVAEAAARPAAERGRQIMALATASDALEQAEKARIEAATTRLYAVLSAPR